MIPIPDVLYDPNTILISSLSGGKDSVAMTLELIEALGPERIVAHLQVFPTAWAEEVPYAQEFCRQVGIRLVAQQLIYEPKPDTARGIRRREIRDIHSPADIVSWEEMIGDPTGLFLRRGWPPSAQVRYCTSSKEKLLNGWIAGKNATGEETVADPTGLFLRRGWPPSAGMRYCTATKRDLLNAWITGTLKNRGLTIVVALGERAAESPSRARKPVLHPRGEPRQSYTLLNWYPVHSFSRRDAFRKLREWGIAPHPAYQYQGMSDWNMYDEEAEGGPRTGCVA